MQGLLSDAQGPKKWRMLPYVLPVLMLLFAIFGPLSTLPATLLGVGSFGLWNLLGLVPWRQGNARRVTLESSEDFMGHRDLLFNVTFTLTVGARVAK